VVRLQCEACGAVICTRHAWDHVACECGDLSASGRPWRPTVHWRASSGGGWTEVNDDATTSELDVGRTEKPHRRIGY
jgi:hypothetical protein